MQAICFTSELYLITKSVRNPISNKMTHEHNNIHSDMLQGPRNESEKHDLRGNTFTVAIIEKFMIGSQWEGHNKEKSFTSYMKLNMGG